MLDWLLKDKKPAKVDAGSMTLTRAEEILDIVSAALTRDDGCNFHPISALQGYDVFQIDAALKLRTANDFLLLTEIGRVSEFKQRIEEVASIPLSILVTFVADAEFDKLKRLPRGSSEYLDMQIRISPCPIDNEGFKDARISALEMLTSFGAYCQKTGASDPIYWQKIYTRIGLPYDSGSPRGNSPVWAEN